MKLWHNNSHVDAMQAYVQCLWNELIRNGLKIDQELIDRATRKKRKGAPRLEERADVEEKRKKARKYLERVESGTSKDTAAGLVGHSRKTLERWVERLL